DVAKAMATGALARCPADISAAIAGVAGPSPTRMAIPWVSFTGTTMRSQGNGPRPRRFLGGTPPLPPPGNERHIGPPIEHVQRVRSEARRRKHLFGRLGRHFRKHGAPTGQHQFAGAREMKGGVSNLKKQ